MFLQLLQNESKVKFDQEKWMKNLMDGTITVDQVAYELKVTSTKRKAIYVNGVFTATEPYFYNEIEVKNNEEKK